MKINALLVITLFSVLVLIWGPFIGFGFSPADTFMKVIYWTAIRSSFPLNWISQVSHLFFFYLLLALFVLMSVKWLK